LVSAISANELARRVEKKELLTLLALPAGPEPRLLHAIEECLSGFNERNFGSNRNVQQNAAAVQLASIASDSKVVVLKGPAGCGKTKIALEFAQITGAKKILWVCPRIQVCEGLFNDLMSSDYLAGATVEISTGARKEIAHGGFIRPTGEGETFSGDVVVTTIDQIVQSIVTHGNVTSLLAFLQAHVVFDEYHEYVGMEAFNLLFAELVLGKQLCAGENKSRTLLVSATPNFFYLDRILGIHPADVVGIDSFNKCPYVLNFEAFDEKAKDNSNPLYALQPANTIVISNTATTAQRSFIRNIQDENAILFHSKFKQADKTKLFNAILKSFGSNGTKEFDVLRSGPAVQAALNITANNMVTELTSAENWLQRLGRLNRFGEFTDTSVYLTAVPASVAEGKIGASAKFLTSLYSYRNACAWNAYLSAILISEAGVKTTGTKTIAEIYAIYEAFHSSKEGQKALELDLLDALAESVKVILARVHDPMAGSKPKGKSSELKLKAVSLRGDSLFVQMAVCQISPLGEGWLDGTYACSEEDSLTLGVSEIESYDPGGDQNLITFMHKNHHKILSFREKKKVAKAYKAVFLKYDAREASKPIYVSYVPKELRDCSTAQHEKARVYAVSDKQPIGVIEFSIINSSQNLVRNT
jgi:CRISPR-associated endonuclease/helicase Cas3